MTPERIKQLADPAAEIADECCYRGDPWYSHVKSAIERAIRQAVNEALEEAMKIADDQIRLAEQIKDPDGYLVSKEIKNAIDALKLPEEP